MRTSLAPETAKRWKAISGRCEYETLTCLNRGGANNCRKGKMNELTYCSLYKRSCPLTGIDNYDDLKDKLSRRNRQIKALKTKINNAIQALKTHTSNDQCVTDVWEALNPQTK